MKKFEFDLQEIPKPALTRREAWDMQVDLLVTRAQCDALARALATECEKVDLLTWGYHNLTAVPQRNVIAKVQQERKRLGIFDDD
jgi:hypothetical protein